MMRVKVERVREGLHPSEVVVAVATADGIERLIVDRRSLEGDAIAIGYPVGQDGDLLLVELPRETQTGLWRVWVRKELVTEGRAA